MSPSFPGTTVQCIKEDGRLFEKCKEIWTVCQKMFFTYRVEVSKISYIFICNTSNVDNINIKTDTLHFVVV